MQYGICIQAAVPVREHPSDKSQMVNQLLFGDTFLIKDFQNGWVLTNTTDDNYEGWVDKKQILEVSQEWYNKVNTSDNYYVTDLCSIVKNGSGSIPVVFGSRLPLLNKNKFFIENNEYGFYGNYEKQENSATGEKIIATAKKYLNSPYLWGGRSPFGIDCSGFTQIVFKINGIFLPRDASQQVEKGFEVSFIEESRTGDLAFFGDEEGSITHVGIIAGKNKIIHASGCVKTDSIDHHGIFDENTKEYSHNLRIIKRLIDN